MATVEESALRYLSSPLGKFRPWVDPETGASPQRDFLRAAEAHKVRIFRAANQTGKTMVAVNDCLLMATGWHPFCNFTPPVRLWYSVLDWEFGVGQVIWPTMQRLMPWTEVRNVLWWRRGDPAMPQAVTFRNGSLLEFKSGEAGRRKYQGAALHGCYVDEEQEPDIIEEIRARLVHYNGYLTVTLTPVRRMRWVMDLERQPRTAVFRATSEQAIRAGIMSREAVAEWATTLSERQKAVRLRGDYAQISGLVYPEFDRDIHVVTPRGSVLVDGRNEFVAPWPLPYDWPRYASMDFGFGNPTAILVSAVDPHTRTVYIERCYYQTGVRASRWGEFMREVMPSLGAPVVCDHDAMERAELMAKGVPTLPARKDVIPGLECVERFLHVREATGKPMLRMIVHDEMNAPTTALTGRCDCHFLAWEMEGYRYPESGREGVADRVDLPIKRDDHALDALRYLLMFLHRRGTVSVVDSPSPKVEVATTVPDPFGWGDDARSLLGRMAKTDNAGGMFW